MKMDMVYGDLQNIATSSLLQFSSKGEAKFLSP